MKRSTLHTAVALVAALSASTAMAQDVPVLDNASIQLKWALPQTDTEVRADGATGNGTPIDFDGDLGFDNESDTFLIGATWRPWENHEFALSYYGIDLDATRRLTRNITFDGQTYVTNSTIKSEFSMDTYDMSYTWWGVNEDNWALGPRIGLVYYTMDLGIGATLDANGAPVGSGVAFASISPDVPAPTIGGALRWRPADQWRVKLDGGYFNANVSDFDGAVTYLSAGVEWLPWENWGFTLNYTRSNIDIGSTKLDFNGDLDFTQSATSLGLIYRF